MRDQRILQALKALAEQDRTLEASPLTGARLGGAFRARRTRKRALRAAAWLMAAAAVVVAGFLVSRPPSKAPAIARHTEQKAPPAPAIAAAPTMSPAQKSRPTRVASAARTIIPAAVPRRESSLLEARRETRREVVTEFYPLMDPAPPFERGQILRVNLPASAMRTVGLPVHDDRLNEPVQADVLMGEEGLPRAIRFVGFQVR